MGRGRNGCKRGKEIVKEGLGQCVVGGWGGAEGVLLRGWRPGPQTQHGAFTLLTGSSGCQGPLSEQNGYVQNACASRVRRHTQTHTSREVILDCSPHTPKLLTSQYHLSLYF